MALSSDAEMQLAMFSRCGLRCKPKRQEVAHPVRVGLKTYFVPVTVMATDLPLALRSEAGLAGKTTKVAFTPFDRK